MQKALKYKEWVVKKKDATLKPLYKELERNNEELERMSDFFDVRIHGRTKELGREHTKPKKMQEV